MEPRTKYLSRIADRIVVKHPLTFLVSLFAHVSVAAIVGILCGSRYAWIGVIVLALFPRFWGHSFFSPKDIPFAAFFTLSTCMGIYLIGQYLKAERQVKIGFNRITVATALYGILVGLLTGIRIGGLVVMFFVVIAHIGARLGKGNLRKDLSNVGALYVLMFATWLTTTILVYPASWSNPIGWFLEAIKLASSYDWPKEVLFDGRSIPAYSLPWYYLPKWIIITVPLPFQISFVLGLILNLVNYHKYSDLQQAAVLLILLQIFFLPILGIIKNSTMYDGMRHFFFILPGVAAISTTVFARFYEKLETGRRQAIAAIIAMSLVVPICLDMIALHPYEHVYFNRASGGLKNAHNRYETDYWGLSLREAMEWINEQGDPNRPVIVGGPFYSAAIYADPRITLMKLDNDLRENIDVPKPFYYLAAPKHGAPNVFPECEVIFQVVRQGIPLSIVKQCN
jgi:4-amino-4-deoxy-L-arabinose transferase-like glycosyltransferase